MANPDNARLRHMLDAAREAVGFAAGHQRADLDTNRMLTLSLVKEIEIIGEGASRVTAPTRASLPAVPWSQIVRMRNRLIHAYFNVDLDIVWDVISHDLPPLIAALEAALGPSNP
jgi:uncharacterized protein with HEPN domain